MNTGRINTLIQEVRKTGEKVTVEAIIIQSLFSVGGTLTDADTRDINNTIWEIKDRISARVNAKYPDGITGLAEGIAINAYFNN